MESCATRNATFVLFTQLPTELRLKIYILSLSSPRLVPLHYLGATTGSAGYSTPHHGCTSPASIPALLHTSHESRALAQEYYKLSFNLDGPTHMFPPKIWFSGGKGIDDVLYFGPQAGYLASFKRFVTAMVLLDPTEALKVRRLAVHEDLFLQVRRERRPFDWNPNASRSKDALVDRCIRDFWENIRKKLRAVGEVIFVGTGMEHQILNGEVLCADTGRALTIGPRKPAGRYQESLHAKIARAVVQLEDADQSWMAPKWRVLALPDHVVAGNMFRSKSIPTGQKVRIYSDEKVLVEKMRCIMCDEKSCLDGDVDVAMF